MNGALETNREESRSLLALLESIVHKQMKNLISAFFSPRRSVFNGLYSKARKRKSRNFVLQNIFDFILFTFISFSFSF